MHLQFALLKNETKEQYDYKQLMPAQDKASKLILSLENH